MTQDMREPEETLRAHRYELVDDHGNTRAVLGRLGDHEGEGFYGLGLFDTTGTRVSFVTGPLGPHLSVISGGTQVVVLGVDEGEDAVLPGAKLVLCDPSGTPFLSLRVPSEALSS